MKITHTDNYAQRRSNEYPAVADQLDAIWKFIESVPGQKPAEVTQMLSDIAAVKAKYPKP